MTDEANIAEAELANILRGMTTCKRARMLRLVREMVSCSLSEDSMNAMRKARCDGLVESGFAVKHGTSYRASDAAMGE